MTVQVYKRTNTGWEVLPGVVDTPVSFGDYLDERLDEGSMTIYRSPVPLYHPDTEFRLDITEGGSTVKRYMLVSSDTPEEVPNGSGLYTHQIALIERTKRLEGIVCNSLTFTNDRGLICKDATIYAYSLPVNMAVSVSTVLPLIYKYNIKQSGEYYPASIKAGNPVSILSISDMLKAIVAGDPFYQFTTSVATNQSVYPLTAWPTGTPSPQ